MTLEGLGFTGADVRRSFELAARTMPVDMLWFDNAGDTGRAITNAEAAIKAQVDLVIEYNADMETNAEIGRRLAVAGIPVLALVDPLPGAPLYGPDNHAAGRIAGQALAAFARENWAKEQVHRRADRRPWRISALSISDRVQGINEGVRETLPTLNFAPLDTGGQPIRADQLLTKFLRTERGRVLIATLDDLSAVYAKNAIEMNRRQSDCIIVSQGVDRNIHGGASEKKEINFNNRGQRGTRTQSPITWTATAMTCCRCVLRLLAGETLPPRTVDAAYPGHRRQRIPGISAVRYELEITRREPRCRMSGLRSRAISNAAGLRGVLLPASTQKATDCCLSP